jgi:steroid delta-isomerase-like uncharacterized protein
VPTWVLLWTVAAALPALAAEEEERSPKQVAQAFIETVWNAQEPDAAKDLFDSDYVDHNPARDQDEDRDGFLDHVAAMRSAFPDLQVTADDTLFDRGESHAVIRWTGTGTHRGDFMSIPPTERTVTVRGVDILRIEEGRIVERWGQFNGLDLVLQLEEKGKAPTN